MKTPIIALLTDFGLEDAYVGLMKAVIATISPQARVIDICHGIPPQNILSGAHVLTTVIPYLPPGSIVAAVVDPGVGGVRRAVGVRTDRNIFIGPDNGLFSIAHRLSPPREAVILDNPEYHLHRVSATFHGRDIFAPVAAHLARGVDFSDLGTPIDPEELTVISYAEPRLQDGEVEAHVVHIDRFGNLITNLTRDEMRAFVGGEPPKITVEGRRIPLVTTFSEVTEGSDLAYFGSTGYLEVAVRNGSAARQFNAEQGSAVIVRKA